MRPRDFEVFGLFVREQVLDEATRLAALECAAAGGGESAAVLPAGETSLAVRDDVRHAWEVPLPGALEGQLVAAIERLRPDIEAWCGCALAPCEAVAVMRYPAGAFYRSHRDRPQQAAAHITRPSPPPAPDDPDSSGFVLDALVRRRVSVVVFLNAAGSAFTGGELRLFDLVDEAPDGLDLVPEAGTLVAFSSDLLHEVRPITGGERVSMVAWLLAPPSLTRITASFGEAGS